MPATPSQRPAERQRAALRLRRLARWLGPLLLLGYLATGVYSVRTNERAVVRRCGRALAQVRKPDLYVGLPWGIDRVSRLQVLETKRVAVGMGLADAALGRPSQAQQAECLTGDRNLIRVSAVVHYTIADPKAYLFAAADVPALVRNAAAAELSAIIAGLGVDDALTVRRQLIQQQARRALQRTLDRYGVGVRVRAITLPSDGVAPPPEVSDAFADVTSARNDRQAAISQAEADAARAVALARGQAQRLVDEATAEAEAIVKRAEGDAHRFAAEAAELAAGNRALTMRRLLLETMEEVLPRVRKIVLDGAARKALDLGLFEDGE